MTAQQGAVGLAHRALAELAAEQGVDGLVPGHQHDPRGAKIEAMDQGATGIILYQPVVHRVEVLRVLARQAQQAARLVDEQQVLILKQNLDGGRTGRGDEGVDDGGHGAHGLKKEGNHTRTGGARRITAEAALVL